MRQFAGLGAISVSSVFRPNLCCSVSAFFHQLPSRFFSCALSNLLTPLLTTLRPNKEPENKETKRPPTQTPKPNNTSHSTTPLPVENRRPFPRTSRRQPCQSTQATKTSTQGGFFVSSCHLEVPRNEPAQRGPRLMALWRCFVSAFIVTVWRLTETCREHMKDGRPK